MKDTAGQQIWTIGHSTRDLDDFVGLLKENEIEALADVRSFPGSRKFPHFNAEALSFSLPEAGIEYIPFKQLGGRRKVRPDSPHTVWRNDAFRGYARPITNFVPRLRAAGATDDVLHRITVDNPRRFLAFVPKRRRRPR